MQKILMLTLGFGFYYAFGLDGIIYGLAASYIPFTIIVYKICKESEINFSELKSRSGFITNNYFESSIGGLRGEVDKLIIAPLLGFAILGNYALALQFYMILMIFSSVVFKYLLPQDSTGIPNTRLKTNTIFMSVGISVLGITLSPIVIPQFFPKFEDAINSTSSFKRKYILFFRRNIFPFKRKIFPFSRRNIFSLLPLALMSEF